MPQELIHFKIAELTADRLANTGFAGCLASRRPALLLGAIFHDALFYVRSRGAAPLEALAHRFHGVHGEDCLDLLRFQAHHAFSATDKDLAAAVFVGLSAHLYADATLHPMVWHFTGDYYAPSPKAGTMARQRHRAIEGLMDRAACPEMFGSPAYHIGRLLKECPRLVPDGIPLTALAEQAGMTETGTEAALRQALILFARIQRACAAQLPSRIFNMLRPVLPDAARELEALFHAPQRLRQIGFLHGSIAYHHPVTGEPATLALNDAMDRAAAQAADCCRQFEGAIFDGKPVTMDTAPSMETGLTGVPADTMRHFAEPPFPDLS
ncbi:zinc dependent phospholipase C family protein [Pseudodesulfovibrio sp.]|uniref:zinc dependent phospholipase C family protein n=1 Tax=unclassified Pseudodesulfovibrio TaxID=2661612 RepID=UPI003B00E177